MQEFFYDIEGIKQVTREVMKPRLLLRIIIFLILTAFSLFQTSNIQGSFWWARFIAPLFIAVVFFVISPGISKARLKKAYESVRIRISTEGIEVEQSMLNTIFLKPENILRIVKEPDGKFYTLHTDLVFKKLRIYNPLNDAEAFDKALNELMPVVTEKNKALPQSYFRIVLLIVTCAAYFFAFSSDSFNTVLISFLLVLFFIGYSIYEAIVRLPMLKGSAAFLTIFYLFVGVALCVIIVLRLIKLFGIGHYQFQ